MVKKKLLMLRPTMGQGGADRVTLTLLRNLSRQQFDLSLVLMQEMGDFLEDMPADVQVYSLGGRRLWTAWWPLVALLRRQQPDILFSTSSGANVIAVLAHRLARQKGKVILSERNVLLHGIISWKKRLLLLVKRFLYSRADKVTVVSQGVADDLIARIGLDSRLISVVYNPVVTTDIAAQAAEEVSHPWFQEDIPVILGAGRFVVEKDFELLIRAFAQVRRERPLRLVILGEGHLRTELLALAQELDVAEDVCLPGFDKNPFKYMARCAIFILSSRSEGLPGVLIQAMACGAAVIATDCPSGPNEIITAEQDGFLVPVGNVEALSERIAFLLDRPEIRRRLARKARLAARRFRVDLVLENYTRALLGQ